MKQLNKLKFYSYKDISEFLKYPFLLSEEQKETLDIEIIRERGKKTAYEME